MKEKAVIAPLMGLASLCAVLFISFLEGRGIGAVPFSLPGIVGGCFGGIVCGGLLFAPHRPRRFAPIVMALLTAISVGLWGVALATSSALSCYSACLFGSMAFPPLLTRLFDTSRTPGFHLGIAMGIGDFFWLFLYVLPAAPSSVLLECLLLLLQALGGILATISLRQGEPCSGSRQAANQPDPFARESLCYLAAIALVYFSLNALIDITFYRMHNELFRIPAQVHLYVWIVYLLAGMIIDRYGADSRLFLACMAGNILSPMSVAITEGTLLYWCIYLVNLSSRGIALIYLLLVLARIRNRFLFPGLVVSIPHLALFFSFGSVYLIVERFPGTTYILLWSIFLAASFSYISSRIQYALTLSGLFEPHDAVGRQDVEPETIVEHANVAHFSEKYGISAREQEVLRLLTKGCDTAKICVEMHISENTVKTHVRQLLRKTETHNRASLTALFFRVVAK